MNANIYVRGNKLWLDYRENGTRYRVASGLKDSKEARKFLQDNFYAFLENKKKAQEAFIAYSDKRCIETLKRQEKSLKTKIYNGELKDLLDRYIKSMILSRHNTLKSYESNKKILLEFFSFAKLFKLSDLNKQIAVMFVKFLKLRGNSNSTIKMRTSAFKRFLTFLVDSEYLENNPFKMPKLSFDEAELEKEEKAFDYEEIKALIANASGDLKDYLTIAFFTGARTGEILGLKKGDVDFENNEIFIQRTRLENGDCNLPKTKHSYRKIDMLPIVKKVIEKRCEKLNAKDEIFANFRAFKLRILFKDLLEKLGFDMSARIYNTRHSFASMMISKGEDIEWVSRRMLGHTNTAMTFQKYSKYLKKDVSLRANFINDEEF